MKAIFLGILLLVPGWALMGCAGPAEGPGGSSGVSISAAFEKSRASSSRAASSLARVRYIVSGPAMRTLTGTAPVEDGLAEFELQVPNGRRRHFVMEALDAADGVRYCGEAWQDLDGSPVTLVIEMAERTLDVSGDWLLYLDAPDDAWEEGPGCMRVEQAGRALSVEGVDAELGRMEGWGVLSGNQVELLLAFQACGNEGTLSVTAATDGDALRGAFTAAGGCRDTPLHGPAKAQRGACAFRGVEVSVRIAHFQGSYALDLFANEPAGRLIESATATGPGVEPLALEYACSLGSCRWFALAPFGRTVPATGDTYAFSLQYRDGSSEVLSDSVYDLGVGAPEPLSPQPGETVPTRAPAFSWQAPAWGCASWYHLIVRDGSGGPGP